MASEVLKERMAAWEALLEEARAYAKRVRETLGDAQVYLYGSVARGSFNLESDIDLLVVSPHLPKDPLERLLLLQSLNPGRVEAKGLTLEEFTKKKDKGALWWLEGALEL